MMQIETMKCNKKMSRLACWRRHVLKFFLNEYQLNMFVKNNSKNIHYTLGIDCNCVDSWPIVTIFHYPQLLQKLYINWCKASVDNI